MRKPGEVREPHPAPPELFHSVYVPDVHVGGHVDWDAFEAALRWLERTWCDAVTLLGDFVDLVTLMKSAQSQPLVLVEEMPVAAELEAGAQAMRRLLAAARKQNPRCQVFYHEGNHEHRTVRFVRMHPQLRGLFDIQILFDLDAQDVTYVRDYSEGEVSRLEWEPGAGPTVRKYALHQAVSMRPDQWGVMAIHGTFHNMHSSKKHVERYSRGHIVFGHVHDRQEWSGYRWGDKGYQGHACGSLAHRNAGYTVPNPTNWRQGLLSAYVERAAPQSMIQANMRQPWFLFHEIHDGRILHDGHLI